MRLPMMRPVAVLVLCSLGCAPAAMVQDRAEDSLLVVVTADRTSFSRGETVRVTVSAENPGDSPIVYGRGSSSCRLGAVVRLGGEHFQVGSRVCTMDIMPLSLDPGERRTESWQWSGEIEVDGARVPLSPGVYDLQGVAGDFLGLPITIEISN